MKGSWLKFWSPSNAIILVWGETALSTVNTSNGMMYPANTSCYEILIKNNHMRVVVFDSNPLTHTHMDVQLFGGAPTLVIDMSKDNYTSTLMPLLRGRDKVICLNTPFYLEKPAIHVTRSSEIGQLKFLMEGSRKFNDELQNSILSNLVTKARDSPLDEKTCSSCMGIFNELVSNDLECGHLVCSDCWLSSQQCYHPQHTRGFLLVRERILPNSPFIDDDDAFNLFQ